MNNNVVRNSYNWFVFLSEQWFSHFGNICVNQMDAVNSKNDLIVISQEIKNTYPTISAELFRLKDNLFDAQLIVNPIVLGELIALLRFLSNTSDNCDFWDMVHPSVVKISKKLYEDGHFANASEDAFIEINSRVKKIYKITNPTSDKVPDGDNAMNVVFSTNNPIVKFADITTETGKNIQKGYMQMFAGAISALRNPKAHANIVLEKEECKRNLIFASMLMYKLDDGVKYTGIQE